MKKLMIATGIMVIASALICQAQDKKSHYTLANTFSVEGDAGWDYLASDDMTGRLFVSHGTVTQVVDENTGKLIATIQDTKGVHGIALAQSENKAFISCGKDSTVSIVNLNTLALINKIKVTGANPDAILYDPYSNKVFTFNGKSSNATVIDAKTNRVVGTISLMGKPEFAVTNEKGKIYVNIEDKSMICIINSSTLKMENYWPLAPGEEPSGLAIDNATHRLFSVCDNNKMVVLDAVSGKVITNLEIGSRVDGCAFDPLLKRAYSSNGDGTITVVQQESESKFTVLENIPSRKGARTICINKKTQHIYLSTAEFGDTPPATPENQHPRPAIKPGTFVILDFKPVN